MPGEQGVGKIVPSSRRAHLGSDAKVFEEPLVSTPKLSPHCLLHLLVGVDQLRGLFKPEVDAAFFSRQLESML
jgi:hypothetical protein